MTSFPSLEPTGALEVRNFSHRFANFLAVEPLDLDARASEFVGILGPSGCGKTTLLRSLAGLISPTSGTASLDGKQLINRPGSVAYLPQSDSLLPWRRALDNAVIGAQVTGGDVDDAREHAAELFNRFGLAGFERSWPHQLSGGMRQRVALLRTFLLPQRLVALDEPFGALDALTRGTMQEWLQSVWMADQRTTLLVTHDVEEALLLADRVLVMSSRPGRLIADVDVALARPRDAALVTSNEFVALKRTVLAALRGGNGKQQNARHRSTESK